MNKRYNNVFTKQRLIQATKICITFHSKYRTCKYRAFQLSHHWNHVWNSIVTSNIWYERYIPHNNIIFISGELTSSLDTEVAGNKTKRVRIVGNCIHFVPEHEPLGSQVMNRYNAMISHPIFILLILRLFFYLHFLAILWYICITLLTACRNDSVMKNHDVLLTFDWNCLRILKNLLYICAFDKPFYQMAVHITCHMFFCQAQNKAWYRFLVLLRKKKNWRKYTYMYETA